LNLDLDHVEQGQCRSIRVGDLVEVNSGGPLMKVVAVGDAVTCVWHSNDGAEQRDDFTAACLTLISD